MRKDNRGLTLIELIVTVAIMMIFSGVVLVFLTGSSGSYRKVSKTAQVQMSMQDVLDELESLVIDANDSVYYAKGTGSIESEKEAISDDVDAPIEEAKTFYIGKKVDAEDENESVSYERIEWDMENQKLIYYSADGNHSLLASDVIGFAADIHRAEKEHVVRFRVTIEIQGKAISNTRTVTLRNQVKTTLSD